MLDESERAYHVDATRDDFIFVKYLQHVGVSYIHIYSKDVYS